MPSAVTVAATSGWSVVVDLRSVLQSAIETTQPLIEAALIGLGAMLFFGKRFGWSATLLVLFAAGATWLRRSGR